eukprot:contig_1174_g161
MGSPVVASEEMVAVGVRARAAALAMARVGGLAKDAALTAVHAALASAKADILAANGRDKAAAAARVADGGLPAATAKRLELGGAKFDALLQGVTSVRALPDPVGTVSRATRLDDGLDLYRVATPIGVIAVVFEARPEAAVQIAALAIKSANAVILKGGKEAEASNAILVQCIRKGLAAADFPVDAVQLVATRGEVAQLLSLNTHIDLVIPRGSNALVKYITENTKIPVMGHADGLCAVYVDAAADMDKAVAIVVDAKAQYPAVCNAAETVLVHADVAPTALPRLAAGLAAAGVELRADDRAYAVLRPDGSDDASSADGACVVRACADDWDTEFLELTVALGVVESLDAAVDHINAHGSHHTDAIVTEDSAAAGAFLARVDSAGVFHNASTRFADGFRYGFGAEVGVSTHRTHARGPVGLEGLLIYKYRLYGQGHTVAAYASGAKDFAHTPLPLEDPHADGAEGAASPADSSKDRT